MSLPTSVLVATPGALHCRWQEVVLTLWMVCDGWARRDAANHPDEPFFIFAAPIAPHEGCAGTSGNRDGDSCSAPPTPAPRHADLYDDVQLPMTSNYGAGWWGRDAEP